MDASVDLAQPLLAIEVIAVFGAIAIGCRPRHDLHQFGPVHVEQARELASKPRVTLRSNVVLGLLQRSVSGGELAVATAVAAAVATAVAAAVAATITAVTTTVDWFAA